MYVIAPHNDINTNNYTDNDSGHTSCNSSVPDTGYNYMNIGSSYINNIKNNYNKDLCTGDILGDIGQHVQQPKNKNVNRGSRSALEKLDNIITGIEQVHVVTPNNDSQNEHNIDIIWTI